MLTKLSLEYWNSIARRHCFVNVLVVEYNTQKLDGHKNHFGKRLRRLVLVES